jgi:hypothetical protein
MDPKGTNWFPIVNLTVRFALVYPFCGLSDFTFKDAEGYNPGLKVVINDALLAILSI